jgi:adenylyl cyclase-associated protein
MADKLESLVNRLEAVASRLEKVKLGGSSAGAESAGGDEVAEQVAAYDEYYANSFKPFLDVSRKIGKELDKAVEILQRAFDENRKVVVAASKSKKPSDQDLLKATQGIAKAIKDAEDYRAKNRGDLYDHLYAISEAIQAFNWVLVPNTTVSFVKDVAPTTEFYTNKVLVKYRKTDPTHGDWVAGLKKWLADLATYVKENHMTGLRFNAQGGDFNAAVSGTASAPAAAKQPATPAPSSQGPPPPPPPANLPPPPPPVVVADNAPAGGMDKVFEQIRSGNVTGGLRHVTKDMKTKNQPNRSSVVPATTEKKSTTTTKATASEKSGPPKLELVDDKKWIVQYQNGNKEVVIEKTELKHTVYVYKCVDTVIQIKGKVNSICLDGCKKTGLVFENAVAVIEVVNCQSVQVQILGSVPTITVDKTDGAQLILSKECMNVQIVTSKSSEMNIVVPTKDGDDTEEIPIPEQYETTFDEKSGKFVTRPTSHI